MDGSTEDPSEEKGTMDRKKKKAILFFALTVSVIAIGALYYWVMGDMGTTPDTFNLSTPGYHEKTVSGDAAEQTRVPPAPESGSIKDKFEQMGVSLEDQLVKELQKYYGATISEKSTQASIYEIRNNIVGSRPDGREFFYKVLKRAFPDLADEIMETLDKLDLYHQWLMENDAVLAQMTPEKRLAALWEKRIELFGDDAEEIWVEDVLATESRKGRVLDTLDFINESPDMPMEEKLDLFHYSLEETYKDSPERYLLDQKPMLAKIFFSIDSVQNELKEMTPEDRHLAINKIRREMGFSQEQAESMEQVDAENNQRWEVGLKYMEERRQVVEQFDGEEEKARIQDLREKYFGNEAQTIRLEEENDDFFRFERPRFYGRN